jgi:hypothetical protein
MRHLQMSNHLRRIEAVEKDLKSLSSASSKKEDVHKLREEMKKVYVSIGELLAWTFCYGLRSPADTSAVMLLTTLPPAIVVLSYPSHCANVSWMCRTDYTVKSWIYEHMYGVLNKICTGVPVKVSDF